MLRGRVDWIGVAVHHHHRVHVWERTEGWWDHCRSMFGLVTETAVWEREKKGRSYFWNVGAVIGV